MLWNFDRFDINSSLWVKQAFEVKKYAFAADYIRLYALYNYGGIYLDTDVEILKPFDDLLDLPYFIGREHNPDLRGNPIEAATMGSEKGIFWLGKCLEYYRNRKFIKWNGLYDELPLPCIMEKVIKDNFKLIPVSDKKSVIYDEKNVFFLQVNYFSPKQFPVHGGEIHITKNTYSIHHFTDTWVFDTTKQKILKNIFENKLSQLFKKIVFKIIKIMICRKRIV
jgi:hypothetical protein